MGRLVQLPPCRQGDDQTAMSIQITASAIVIQNNAMNCTVKKKPRGKSTGAVS
jgi:hypothetical protein